ncbi:MAG TPA: hypothetical protein DFS52_32190 [Myxococcales bacterium]|nr:hypothetical protein [Myxococcales bacterium]
MEARLRDFGELLRHNGIRVGPGEIADACRAVALVGLEDRDTFRAALRSCLVKRGLDAALFDRLFDLYFKGAAKVLDAIEGSLLEAIEQGGFLEGDELAMVVATINQLFGEMSPLARAAVEGDKGALARIFRGATLSIDFSRLESQLQTGFFARRLLSNAGADEANRNLEELERLLAAQGVSVEGVELVSKRLSAAMRQVEEAARQVVEQEARARLRRDRPGWNEDRPFLELSPEELERTSIAVRRLAERLKTRLVRRQRTRRKGRLSVRRTLRKNLSWGGVPARLAFKSRRPERPDVVVVCDVSDSVRNTARMMLLFVHTLQSLFNRVRSFVFVSDLGEVTEFFRRSDPREAIELALAGEAINMGANSNYGRVFAMLAKDYLGAISRRTTLLVIGDGRNNYNESHLWALEELKRKARRVVWICSEDRRFWGAGDSEMLRYSKACDRVAVVQSLSDLTNLADELVPRGG